VRLRGDAERTSRRPVSLGPRAFSLPPAFVPPPSTQRARPSRHVRSLLDHFASLRRLRQPVGNGRQHSPLFLAALKQASAPRSRTVLDYQAAREASSAFGTGSPRED
jgi:hypothetical protein